MATAKSKTNQTTPSISDAIKILDTAVKAMKKKQYLKAREILDKLNADYANDLELRGKIHTLVEICEARMEKPEKPVRASDIDDPAGLYNLGVYLHNEREYEEALECFEKALKLSKKNQDHYFYAMAASKSRMENFKEAAEDLKKAVEMSMENLYHARNDPDFLKLREDAAWNLIEAAQSNR